MATSLTRLGLYGNNVGADGVASLAPALSRLLRLEDLSLSYNAIGAGGAAALAPALGLLSRLRHLSLDGNPVGDEGVSQLVPVLARLPRLRSVSLGEPHAMSERGTAALLAGLPTSVSVLFDRGCERIRRRQAELQRKNRGKRLKQLSVTCLCVLCTCQLLRCVEQRPVSRNLLLGSMSFSLALSLFRIERE